MASPLLHEARDQLAEYLRTTEITVGAARSEHVLDLSVTVSRGDAWAVVRAVNEHTNLVYIERSGQVLRQKAIQVQQDPDAPDYSLLNVQDICDFAQTCRLEDVSPILQRQIDCNTAVAEEGLRMELMVSVPIPIRPMLAAMAAPVPPEEPPGVRVRS